MNNNEEYNDFINNLKDKLDDNPELKEEIQNNVARLSEIFNTEVDISLNFSSEAQNYKEIFNGHKETFIEPDISTTMNLGDFKKMLNEEDDDLKLSFDSLYMEHGVNNVNNMLITTYGNNIIIIPTVYKEK